MHPFAFLSFRCYGVENNDNPAIACLYIIIVFFFETKNEKCIIHIILFGERTVAPKVNHLEMLNTFKSAAVIIIIPWKQLYVNVYQLHFFPPYIFVGFELNNRYSR